jgi:hypothetical protein
MNGSRLRWTRWRSDEGINMKLANTFLATLVAVVGVPGAVKADLITDWNMIAVNTVVAGEAVTNRQSRDLAMVHAAMFDAMNTIRPRYTSALVSVSGIRGYASHEMAGAQAAHDVLVALFPANKVGLDANLAATADQIPDDPPSGKQPKARGIAAGQQAAAAVLALRANDHAFEVTPYVQQPAGPGIYQFTPGCSAANMSVPGWGNVTPFTLPDPDAFPLPAHPSTSDPQFLADLAETRDYGRSDSTIRTAEQTNHGLFFIESANTAVNRLARSLVAQEPVETNRAHAAKQLLAHARLFAAINISQADTYVRTWRSKYGNNFWRPYTAVRAVFGDNTWTPLRQTPCHPEFFAGHGTLSPAGITALQNHFSDAVNVDATSTSLVGVTRHYTSLNQYIEDVNLARIYSGFHYRHTMQRSNVLGRAVANWVNDHMMVPLDDDDGEDDCGSHGHHQGQPVHDHSDGSNNDSED